MRLLFFFLFLFGMVVAMLIHLSIASRPMPRGRYLEIIVLHMLFWGVGLIVTLTAINELIGPYSPFAKTASQLGPQAQKQFHVPIGFAGLTLGILGLFCTYFRGGFWVATALAILIFNLCETALVFTRRESVDIEIVTFLWDIIGPVLLCVMMAAYRLRAGYSRFWYPKPHFKGKGDQGPRLLP